MLLMYSHRPLDHEIGNFFFNAPREAPVGSGTKQHSDLTTTQRCSIYFYCLTF